jgi:hypothetical protein
MKVASYVISYKLLGAGPGETVLQQRILQRFGVFAG